MTDSSLSRRRMLQAIGAAAAATALSPRIAAADGPQFARMPPEGKGTPRICLGGVAPDDTPAMRRLKQIGVNSVLTGGPRIPWEEVDLRSRIERFKAGGLVLWRLGYLRPIRPERRAPAPATGLSERG